MAFHVFSSTSVRVPLLPVDTLSSNTPETALLSTARPVVVIYSEPGYIQPARSLVARTSCCRQRALSSQQITLAASLTGVAAFAGALIGAAYISSDDPKIAISAKVLGPVCWCIALVCLGFVSAPNRQV